METHFTDHSICSRLLLHLINPANHENYYWQNWDRIGTKHSASAFNLIDLTSHHLLIFNAFLTLNATIATMVISNREPASTVSPLMVATNQAMNEHIIPNEIFPEKKYEMRDIIFIGTLQPLQNTHDWAIHESWTLGFFINCYLWFGWSQIRLQWHWLVKSISFKCWKVKQSCDLHYH